MKMSEDIKQIKDFIFNDEVQNILAEVNNNLMDFNILEITGMGHQETKHSNILGWLFDDSEHNLEYKILDEFLKKVILKNNDNDKIENLKEYIYLSVKSNLQIYREKENIDLLVVDENNKVIITIENKVFASERKDGDDGGQLNKYKTIINNKYDDSYKKFFIFLTINLEEPSKGNWIKANHQMITDIIEKQVKDNQDLSDKTKIIFNSYVDLLKRRNIVEDKELKHLCDKIWNNQEYSNALEILFNYKPNKRNMIIEVLDNMGIIYEEKSNNGSYNFFIQFKNNENIFYRIVYSTGQKIIKCRIVAKNINDDEIKSLRDRYKNPAKDTQFGYTNITQFETCCSEDEITKEKFIKRIQNLINGHKDVK
jgi:hypothetical protein